MVALNLKDLSRDTLEHIVSFLPLKAVLSLRESGDAPLLRSLFASVRYMSLIRVRKRPYTFASVYAPFTHLQSLQIHLSRGNLKLAGSQFGVGYLPASLRQLELEGDDSLIQLLPVASEYTPSLAERCPLLTSLKIKFTTTPTSFANEIPSTSWIISHLKDLPLTKLHIDHIEHPSILEALPSTLTELNVQIAHLRTPNESGKFGPKSWPVRWPLHLTSLTASLPRVDMSQLPTRDLAHLQVLRGRVAITPEDIIETFNFASPSSSTTKTSSNPSSSPCSQPRSMTSLTLALHSLTTELALALPLTLTRFNLSTWIAPNSTDMDSFIHGLPRTLKHLRFGFLGSILSISGAGLPKGLLSLDGLLVAPENWKELPRSLTSASFLERLPSDATLFIPTMPPSIKIQSLYDVTKDMIDAIPLSHDCTKISICGFKDDEALAALSRFSVCSHFRVMRPLTLSKFDPGCKVIELQLDTQWSVPNDLNLNAPWASQLSSLSFTSLKHDREDDDMANSLFGDDPAPTHDAPPPSLVSDIDWIKSLPHSLTKLEVTGCDLDLASMPFLPSSLRSVFINASYDGNDPSLPNIFATMPSTLSYLVLRLQSDTVNANIPIELEEMVASLPKRLEHFSLLSRRPSMPSFTIISTRKKGPLVFRPVLRCLPYIQNFMISSLHFAYNNDFRTLQKMQESGTLPEDESNDYEQEPTLTAAAVADPTDEDDDSFTSSWFE